jgi:transcriptional regulator with XRE-family HTH domain
MSNYEQLRHRVKTLRETAKMSQGDLAQRMKLTRSAVSQIETGERKLSAEELIILSKIFHLSTDELINPGKAPEVIIEKETEQKARENQVRINVPQKNVKKFKQVLLYILNKIGAKPNIGETVINKLLYFIDFNFYEEYENQLMGATYQKNKYGPTAMEFKKIREQMIKDKDFEVIKSEYFSHPQTKYLPLKTPDLSLLCANEVKTIDEVLNKLSDMTANQISDYSHQDVPWLVTKEGEMINYETVFYRTPPYSVRAYESDENER